MWKPLLFTFLILFFSVWHIRNSGAAPTQEKNAGLDTLTPSSSALASEIKTFLEGRSASIGTHPLSKRGELEEFYRQRNFEPLFTGERGPTSVLHDLVATLPIATDHGLVPNHYRLSELQQALRESAPTPSALRDLELMAAESAASFLADISGGKVTPSSIGKGWGEGLRTDQPKGAALLTLFASSSSMRSVLPKILPTHEQYGKLVGALAEYRSGKGEVTAPTVADGPTLKLGGKGPRVQALVQRLRAIGLYTAEDTDTVTPAVIEAVKILQRTHNLTDDGAIGAKTIKIVNASGTDRINTIAANLERWRWTPRSLEPKRIAVNIPGYLLELYEGGAPILTMATIVGKDTTLTPVMRGEISRVEFNPYWNVPQTIFVNELLPKLRTNPAYFEEKHFEIVNSEGNIGVAPDWSTLQAETPGFRVRQTPGAWNELGQFKFIFPNSEDIFLHDTRDAKLFEKDERTLSHGCIRVEKPMALALQLLEGTTWSGEAIEDLLSSRTNKTVTVENPVPVYLEYWTAIVDQTGKVQFLNDIYGADAKVVEQLGGE